MTPNPIAVCSKKGDQAGLSQAIHGTWERLGQNEMGCRALPVMAPSVQKAEDARGNPRLDP